MELEDDGWWNEMGKYILSIESLTVKALKRIKRGRIQSHLPFDGAFQKYFLQKTNARIADVYTDFLLDGILEDGEIASNQDVNQRNHGNGNANIFEMPIVLGQLNNRNASAPFVQNDNGMSEHIVISIPSNKLPIPTQMDLNENSKQKSRGSSGSVLLTASNANNNTDTKKENAVGGGGLTIESTSTSAINTEFSEQLEGVVNSKMHQPVMIDLTMDQAEANSVLACAQKDIATSNVQPQAKCQKRATANVNRKKDFSRNDARMPNMQQESRIYLNGGPSSSIDTANVSHHSENIMSNNGTDEVATVDDDLDLTVRDGAANQSNDDDNLQRRFAALSKIKNALNSHETLSGSTGAADGKSGNQRHSMAMVANDLQNMQHQPESIDLISDAEDVESQAADGFPKDVQIVADGVHPTARGRKREDGNAIARVILRKKLKLANKRAVKTEKQYKCDSCEYSTVYKQHLNDHIRTHTNERPQRCEVCEKRFSHKCNLIRHMKAHRDMFAFQCSSCRRGFSTEKEWKLHEGRCQARGYECHLCKKVFIDKRCLVDHMRKHTGEKLHCPKCRKKFGFNHSLAHHMKSHGNLFRFQCSNCRRGFSNKTSWKLHESLCKSKQFECFLCGKKFHQLKSHLLVHMRHKHTGEKPFACSNCQLRFVQKSTLTRHTERCQSKNY